LIKIKNCAIFGGTFDPIHNGHIHIIESLRKLNRFEKLVIVPAGDPWQKETKVNAKMRLEMLKLALSDLEIEISESELNRNGPSYALDTVKELTQQFPAERYTWILGSDAFANLGTWHKIEELLGLVDFLVVVRPGSTTINPTLKVNYQTIELGALEISATEIRNKISRHESCEELLPAGVWRYIKENGLYGAA
jgi:nicotinate-nucleotide adenylyltransferase